MNLFITTALVIVFKCGYILADYPLRTRLTLLTTDNDEHNKINKNFNKQASKMGFEIEIVPIEKSNIPNTINASKKYRNVINLRTDNFCDQNMYETFLKSNLMCANEIEEEWFRFTVPTRENDCQTNQNVTLIIVSESTLLYNRLSNILQTENFEINDRVLVCLPNNLQNIDNIRNIEKKFNGPSIVLEYDCKGDRQIDNTIVAVLTPVPMEFETKVPVIFYNTPHLVAEKKSVNSLNLLTSLKPLKYAFMQLLEHMNWQRVAVLSDDSDSSAEFLAELLPLFKKKKVVYTYQYCTGRFCDFSDALNLLKMKKARIIILNVDERNAEHVIQQIASVNIKYIQWIVRDWPFHKHFEFPWRMSIFSITLSPVFRRNYMNDVPNEPYLSGIIEGLIIIDYNYKVALGDRKIFTRNFNNSLVSQDYKTYAYVTKLGKGVVGHMLIEGSHVKEVYFAPNIYKGQVPLDIYIDCITRSMNFFKPCNDRTILLFISVVVMFTLLFLIIIVYFNKCQNSSYGRIF